MEYYDLQIDKIIKRALEEDLGWGDVTTDTLIPGAVKAEGLVKAKCEGIVSGTEVAQRVFQRVDSALKVDVRIESGGKMQPGDILLTVSGSAAAILRAERTALNFVQRMSGIATETARFVAAARDMPVRIADTRKTAPGLRVLDKMAVRAGGGINHRMHLGDGVLVKDNHLDILRARGMKIKDIVAQIRERTPRILSLEVEVTTAEEAAEAASAGADIILLDNMDVKQIKRAVAAVNGRALVEASGGMTLEKVKAVAGTGVDFISVGSLTHSVRAMDLSLDIRILKEGRSPKAA